LIVPSSNGGKAGTSREVHWKVAPTSLGPVLAAASDVGVCSLLFGSDAAALRNRFRAARLVEGGEPIMRLLDRVVAAIEAPSDAMLDIPIDVRGTPFQLRVWEALRAIPCGETRSYGDLAREFGTPGAARAIGGANGANRIAVLIPCHRVIAADGTLGGYAWGLEVKRELLRREGAALSHAQPVLL
jgi:AraC family transcriptional regulator, regulatory protein of adaptative response / methylated-DNA-[protein]-cysteine methyltransferase